MVSESPSTDGRIRVGFLYFGDQQPAIARRMIASVREHMPQAILVQLTNRASRALPDVDEVRRIDGTLYGYLLFKHMMSLPTPFVRIDYDMVLQTSLDHVFEGDFDVALNEQGDESGIEFVRKYRYAGSVWAGKGKAHEFATVWRKKHIHSGMDDWLGLIPVLNDMVQDGFFKVKTLPGRVYNYIPKHRNDHPASAAVIHYKGMRKRWLFALEDEHLASADMVKVGKRVQQYRNPHEIPGLLHEVREPVG